MARRRAAGRFVCPDVTRLPLQEILEQADGRAAVPVTREGGSKVELSQACGRSLHAENAGSVGKRFPAERDPGGLGSPRSQGSDTTPGARLRAAAVCQGRSRDP